MPSRTDKQPVFSASVTGTSADGWLGRMFLESGQLLYAGPCAYPKFGRWGMGCVKASERGVWGRGHRMP
ncbi:hypothetical protein [Myxococcus sp. AB056]|uniref:hypothetical protein n=1 Tax=Myxococcus sp. AB056 TaxID=2562792 RepID=UPI001147526D|nr:hypothetical protein [Myxococcus sp. AB056]